MKWTNKSIKQLASPLLSKLETAGFIDVLVFIGLAYFVALGAKTIFSFIVSNLLGGSG